jgi:large subunit ribosomal protein L35Ae
MSQTAAAAPKTSKKQVKPVAPKKAFKKPANFLRKHGHIQKVIPRLYVRAIFVGYKRQKHTQHNHVAVLKIENVESREEAQWYVGKKCAYVVKAKRPQGSTRRFKKLAPNAAHVTWGKIRKVHGNSGCVYATFKSNLPPVAMGRRIRVMLYPSNI